MKCEAAYSKDRKSWALFTLPNDGKKYVQCGQPAVVKVNNEYVDLGGEPEIWLCDECDKKSATQAA